MQWGTSRYDVFSMSNGIRQGSMISPFLFNICMDELNGRVSSFKVGCQIGGMSSNSLGLLVNWLPRPEALTCYCRFVKLL